MKGLDWKRRMRRYLSRTLRPPEAWLRKRLLLAVDRVVMLAPTAPQDDRVLLVRLDNIGDFVLWLHAARAIVQHFQAQGKQVTLVANAVWKDWAAELGIFDEVIGVDARRFREDLRYRFRVGRLLRQSGCGIAVQPAATRVLALGDSIVRVSGATERVGPRGGFENTAESDRAVGDRWYTSLLRIDPTVHNELRRNAAFVRLLTGTDYKARVADLRAHLELGLDPVLSAELAGRPYFVLFPGASHHGRLWPVERYVEIARKLHMETGWMGVVSGGPGEAAQAAHLCADAQFPMLNWVGRTTLTQLAAVLANAEIVIANDTSAVHIAAAVGVPSVSIVGGGHYERFLPYEVEQGDERPLPAVATHKMECFHCEWRCIHHPPKGAPFPCIENISAAEVWAVVQQVLASRGAASASRLERQPSQLPIQQRAEVLYAIRVAHNPRVTATATL